MLILDARKQVGISTRFNGNLQSTIEPFLHLPCVQIGYNAYEDLYNNDGSVLASMTNLPHLYLHSSNRTNISNTSSNSGYVVSKSLKHVSGLLSYSSYINASVIVHYGTKGNLDKTLDSLKRLQYPKTTINDYPLLLENAAGEGTELGVTLDEIRYVFEHMDNSKIGMCLDTAHAFGAGYNLTNTDVMVNLLDELDSIAPKRLKMVHLNDSKVPCASKVDRHENIGQGYIWSNDQSSLDHLLVMGADLGIQFILETPDPLYSLNYLQHHHLKLRRR